MTTDISKIVPLTTMPAGGKFLLAKTSPNDPTRRVFDLLEPSAVGGGGGTPGAGTPGGSAGQLQWNHSGAFDGFTPSGDVSIDPVSGLVTLTGKGSANGPVVSDSSNKVPLAQLPLVTRALSGIVPPPGTGTGITKFLREDLTWGIPPGSSVGANIPAVVIDGSIIPATSGAPYQMTATDFRVLCQAGAPTFLILPSNPVLGVPYLVFSPLTNAALNLTTVSAPSGATVQGTTIYQQAIDEEVIWYMAITSTIWRLS